MTGASIQDWIFWLTGGFLALAGLTLAIWALFWDRSRSRKRCPKCWYDMSGAIANVKDGRDVFVCPECGQVAVGEKRLFAVRRRWRWIGPATALGLAAYGAVRFPEVRAHGWIRLIPTSALVYLAPMDKRAWTSPFPANKMTSDLVRRLGEGQLSEWQSQVCFDRYYKALPDDFSDDWQINDVWPSNATVVMRIGPPILMGVQMRWLTARARFAGIGSIWVSDDSWLGRRNEQVLGVAPSAPSTARIELQIVAPGLGALGRNSPSADPAPVRILWRGEKVLKIVPAPAPATP